MSILNAMPGAVAQGLIWGLMAIGVYISYKILDIADLTVDGSLCTGGCVCAFMLMAEQPIWLCILAAFAAGALAGVVTGLLHTLLGIPSILAGILTQLSLYSVNLAILDHKASQALFPYLDQLLVDSSDDIKTIIVGTGVVAVVIIGLWLFFYTEIGLTLKSTGDNPDMSRAQGVNVNRNKVIGLAISNGLVALSGCFLTQYNNNVTINDGRGAIVIGLAAIFIGLSVSMKIKPNFVVSLIGVVFGSIVYFAIYTIVVQLKLMHTDYLKMMSALIVVLFLGVPYIKGKLFAGRTARKIAERTVGGGQPHA